MTIVIRFELGIRDQIGTPVGFDIKNGNPPRNAGTLKTIVCQTSPLAKLSPGGGGGGRGSYLFIKYDVFRQIADFLRNGADQLYLKSKKISVRYA